MPAHAKSYEHTIVYKIFCNDPEVTDFYIGHTANFNHRKCNHGKNSRNPKYQHQKIYQVINAHGGWDNWSMVILETACLANVEEAKAREHYWVEKLRPTMNTNAPLLFGLKKEEVEKERTELGLSMEGYKCYKLNSKIKALEDEVKRLKTLLDDNNIEH